MDMMRLAREERADFAAFLDGLEPWQWDEPTLCTGWRVRDVVAHVISYDELDWPAVLRRFVRGRLNPARINALGLAEYRTRPPGELVALLRAHLEPRGLPAARGGMVAFLDGLIHQQDIRRPLGLPRQIPAERLAPALRCAMVAPPIGAFWRARGLRLVATDAEFVTGKGPEVRGPAESVLLAIAGRRGVVAELSGPGQPALAARIGG